jgi:sucrose phosphorylase
VSLDGEHTAPQLITYADRLGGSLSGVTELLRGPFAGAFGGVHLLPFFRPFDGADAGFDPEDHREVDTRLGTWQDVRELSGTHGVMSDLIVNHVSAQSPQFRDVRRRGDASPWRGMFLTMGSVFPDGATEMDLAAIFRPRPGLPFTAMDLGGRRHLVWTTFTSAQVDLDIRAPQTWAYLIGIIDRLTDAGVSMLRLDAAGYVGKTAGTTCFLTDEALAFIRRLRSYASERGAATLIEVHAHHTQQVQLAEAVDWVYDFALPPLVLHALVAGDAAPLADWLEVRPANCVSVLDTHDGIGIVDVGRNPTLPGVPGLLSEPQIDALVEAIHRNTDGTSRLATGAAASNLDLYQVNSTFYDALGRDDLRYLLARLIQLFLPGIPQVYYVGLLAGSNDVELLQRTGVGRDINRHHYGPEEIEAALLRPVVAAQLAALRLRAAHPAFRGDFTYRVEGARLELSWRHGSDCARLEIDVADLSHQIYVTHKSGHLEFSDVLKLGTEPVRS